jgi:hypothetical protein
MAEVLAAHEPAEDELDDIIELAVHEGVSPPRGFQLVLDRLGTCSAVTMFEQSLLGMQVPDRGAVAGLIVRHLARELTHSLKIEIQRQEGAPPAETSIRELIADREWLFQSDGYHIDTSHLGMATRFAIWIEDPAILELALELTEYGRRLSPQFQPEGDEPFADAYVDHGRFFAAQIGRQVEEHLAFFRTKSTLDPREHGTLPAEVYVALLRRLGRHREAQSAVVDLLPPSSPTIRLAPSLLELAEQTGDFEPLRQVSERRDDRVNFLAGLLREHGK